MELRYILPRSWTDCVLPTIAEACQSLAPGAAAKEGCGVLAMAAGGEFEGLRGNPTDSQPSQHNAQREALSTMHAFPIARPSRVYRSRAVESGEGIVPDVLQGWPKIFV
eukprot:2111604-Rhodomonas_salina.2